MEATLTLQLVNPVLLIKSNLTLGESLFSRPNQLLLLRVRIGAMRGING